MSLVSKRNSKKPAGSVATTEFHGQKLLQKADTTGENTPHTSVLWFSITSLFCLFFNILFSSGIPVVVLWPLQTNHFILL